MAVRRGQPAGQRNKIVTILRYIDSVQESGETVRSWLNTGAVRAEVEVTPAAPSGNQIRQEMSTGYVFTLMASVASGLRSDDRLVYGGITCAIVNVIEAAQRYVRIEATVIDGQMTPAGVVLMAGQKVLVIG